MFRNEMQWLQALNGKPAHTVKVIGAYDVVNYLQAVRRTDKFDFLINNLPCAFVHPRTNIIALVILACGCEELK